MKKTITIIMSVFIFYTVTVANNSEKIGSVSSECIDCHSEVTPGIVKDWEQSRHAHVLKNDKVISCAECHTIRPEKHGDTFDHNDQQIHIVVSPPDCATCHPEEEKQYQQNLMSHAYGNLMGNSLYRQLIKSILGDEINLEDSCLQCHGTVVKKTGTYQRETDFGEMIFPKLEGWPNQGVGRINPDSSRGSCSACHTRHSFSMEMARKPHTCSKCHKGPDVPAYKVYLSSKHGNIYSSLKDSWNFKNQPWVVGKDITAPTCATCHISELSKPGGEIISQRTHRMNDRLPYRMFGLIYSHPHPLSPDTSKIKNSVGLPLPTELTGEPVKSYLITESEKQNRLNTMKKVCSGCHSSSLIDAHFDQMEKTIIESDQLVKKATQLIMTIWEKELALGPAQNDSPFNEYAEKIWTRCWLYYANAIRLASSMMGPDYGVFANGRFQLSENILKMKEIIKQAPVKE